ncbi:MAG: PIN domain-containing protein [Pseudomonadota bacterium]
MRVFLDACVLYPPLLRRLVLAAAAEGLFDPLWSARVLDEWLIATARKAPDQLAEAEADRALLAARFPEALCPAAPDLEATLSLPDPADAHVLAAAAEARANLLLTLNLRDFPRRTLAAHGIEARHPDSLLWELWSDAPAPMETVLATALPGLDPPSRRGPLKRARLSRLGKAQAA